MTDDRSDRELRRFLEWDSSQIDGAPSLHEMIERVAPTATRVRRGRPWAFPDPGTPAFRVILVVGLLGALVAGAFAAGAWLNRQNPLVVVVPSPTVGPPPRLLSGQVVDAGLWYLDLQGVRITLDPPDGWGHGWSGDLNWFQPPDRPALLLVTSVTNTLATPCGIPRSPAIGPSVDDLVTGLMELGLGASTPVDGTVDSYTGKQLTMVAPPSLEGCTEVINVWLNGGGTTSYLDFGEETSIWVVDVDGTRLLLRTMVLPDTTPQELSETQRMFESIQLVSLASCLPDC